MNDLSEYELRIGAALDRIGQVLAGTREAGATAAPQAGVTDLQDALDAERTANAQLTERVRAIKDKQETMVAALERNVARLTQQLDAQARELQRQKRLNTQITETNRALSDAARKGVTEPHLVNKAMMTELEALRAARAADVAEMDEILSELKPLIGEVA
jgi:DNA repair exonuclease SbcCD ATPase subunit